MKNVYLLMVLDYDCSYVRHIYERREDAEAERDWLKKLNDDYGRLTDLERLYADSPAHLDCAFMVREMPVCAEWCRHDHA